MENKLRQASESVSEFYEDFEISSVWQTKEYYVFIDEVNIGIPPVIVNKQTNEARFAVIGDPADMKLVFKDSVLVERLK